MQAEIKLTLVKTVHTIIWLCFNVIIFYMGYAVIVNKLDRRLWIGYGIIIIEGLVLFAFNYACPLTILAHKYSTSTRDNFDIFLPEWLARYNKLIYTFVIIIIAVITIVRLALN